MSAPARPQVAAAFEYTPNLPSLLERLRLSLFVSTYQAGKLVVVGARNGELVFSFVGFEQAMGLAVTPDRMAVGAKRIVWLLTPAHHLARQQPPAGTHDACFLTRTGHVTGSIHVHEMGWGGTGRNELWVVNTLFSCLCTLHPEYSFVPRWKPKFVSALAAEDRCHLNGMALADGRPKLVTALAETDTPAGWRPNKATSGVVIDVPSGGVVARGLSMPHSPRVAAGRAWVLDSGRGRLAALDLPAGKVEPVAELSGYTRGLSIAAGHAFVGLSKIRETNVFGGLPIGDRREALRCGVEVVDLSAGRCVAGLYFNTGVDEVFAVETLAGPMSTRVIGPAPDADGADAVWLAPEPGREPPLAG